MTLYLSNRDGDGKTDEEGHYKFQTSVWTGNVLGSTSLYVSQNAPLGMSVIIAPGQFKIDTSSGYSYTGWNSSNHVQAISTADAANPRITSIVAYVDKGAPTSPLPPNNPGIVKFASVNGVPTASPSAPASSVIQTQIGASNPYIVLANVRVPASATQIVNTNITDVRVRVTLGQDLISTDSIIDSAVTTNKLNNLSVTTDKLANLSVTSAKLADGSIDDTKWRNLIAFSARRTTTRNFAGGTWTKIAANITDFNYGGGYSNAADIGRFTAPTTGLYLFSVTMNTETVAQTRCIVSIYKNGSENTRLFDNTATDINVANGATMLRLNAGDYVEAWGWTGAAGNIAHATRTSFDGALVTRM